MEEGTESYNDLGVSREIQGVVEHVGNTVGRDAESNQVFCWTIVIPNHDHGDNSAMLQGGHICSLSQKVNSLTDT